MEQLTETSKDLTERINALDATIQGLQKQRIELMMERFKTLNQENTR